MNNTHLVALCLYICLPGSDWVAVVGVLYKIGTGNRAGGTFNKIISMTLSSKKNVQLFIDCYSKESTHWGRKEKNSYKVDCKNHQFLPVGCIE